ncbi:MAG: hypothetical protein FWG53_04530 [Clostridiales bacterium]|nr:hypothetical protein [Clostridiales bacterium]
MKKTTIAILVFACLLFFGCGQSTKASESTNASVPSQPVEIAGSGSVMSSQSGEIAKNEPVASSHFNGVHQFGETWEKTAIGDAFEIQEQFFIQQFDDIYLNPDDYLGKTIKYEGLVDMYQDFHDESITHYFIYRMSTGCCAVNPARAGFDIDYNGAEYPNGKPGPDDWVAVEGTLSMFEYEDGVQDFVITDAKLTVKSERGEDMVYN